MRISEVFIDTVEYRRVDGKPLRGIFSAMNSRVGNKVIISLNGMALKDAELFIQSINNTIKSYEEEITVRVDYTQDIIGGEYPEELEGFVKGKTNTKPRVANDPGYNLIVYNKNKKLEYQKSSKTKRTYQLKENARDLAITHCSEGQVTRVEIRAEATNHTLKVLYSQMKKRLLQIKTWSEKVWNSMFDLFYRFKEFLSTLPRKDVELAIEEKFSKIPRRDFTNYNKKCYNEFGEGLTLSKLIKSFPNDNYDRKLLLPEVH